MNTTERALQGQTTRLRPFTDDDVQFTYRWFNDPEVLHWLHLSEDPPEMMKSFQAHVERWERIRDDPGRLAWLIETKEGAPIGDIGLMDIHPTHGRADLAISIGEKANWGQGCGTDAIRTLLGFAFGEMELRRVTLITDEDNARAIRCYEKCGFVREGLLRAHRLRHGRPINMIAMGLLREDWDAARRASRP